MDENGRKALTNALATLSAVYEWVDRVENHGGVTTISGVAECHAMLKSLKQSRKRMVELVIDPARAALGQ